MKTLQKLAFAAMVALVSVQTVPAQEPQQPDINEIINKLLESLTNSYKLDDVQIFYVDSILQYNYPAMMDEIEATRKTGASNSETFQAVSDKWMAATDDALEKVFTEDQWRKYMKSSFGKEKKRRDKRIADRGPVR